VGEHYAALKRVLADSDTFWSDARRRMAIVSLLDWAQHVEEAMQGCRRALTTMFLVMLLMNPFPDNFHQLLYVLDPVTIFTA
jgi:predicted phosphatase